jgi:hypothetical protein
LGVLLLMLSSSSELKSSGKLCERLISLLLLEPSTSLFLSLVSPLPISSWT